MHILDGVVGAFTRTMRTVAALAVVGILALLLANVLLRPFGHPILGVIDLVQYAMLTLIMTGLGYVQSTDSHISVDIVTARFGSITQRSFELAAHLLTIVVTGTLAVVFLYIAMTTDSALDSGGLVRIPSQPFKYLVFLGFLGWAAEAVRLAAHTVLAARHPMVGQESE